MHARRCIVAMVVLVMAMAAMAPAAQAGDEPTFGDPGTPPGAADPLRDDFFAGESSRGTEGREARGITVDPATDLLDGQVVTVDGTGFADDDITGIFQCAKAMGIDGCDQRSVLIFGFREDTFTREFRVDAILETEAGEIDCRTYVDGCRLVANDNYSLASAGKADLSFDPDAPLEPPPTVAVNPATDLVDGQVVQVTGSDFRPDEHAMLAQCPEGEDDLYEACGNFWYVEADADGNIDLPYQVEALLDPYYYYYGSSSSEGFFPPDPTDCREEACELVAVTEEDFDRVGRAALAFDPDAPLRPDMVISVTPNDELVDGQALDVQAQGYTPDGPVDVVQCSLNSDLEGSGCDLDRVQNLTADSDGEVDTTYTVYESFTAPGGEVDCLRSTCILVAVDRSVPIDFGRGYTFEYLDFAGDDVVDPATPTPVTPQFTG